MDISNVIFTGAIPGSQVFKRIAAALQRSMRIFARNFVLVYNLRAGIALMGHIVTLLRRNLASFTLKNLRLSTVVHEKNVHFRVSAFRWAFFVGCFTSLYYAARQVLFELTRRFLRNSRALGQMSSTSPDTQNQPLGSSSIRKHNFQRNGPIHIENTKHTNTQGHTAVNHSDSTENTAVNCPNLTENISAHGHASTTSNTNTTTNMHKSNHFPGSSHTRNHAKDTQLHKCQQSTSFNGDQACQLSHDAFHCTTFAPGEKSDSSSSPDTAKPPFTNKTPTNLTQDATNASHDRVTHPRASLYSIPYTNVRHALPETARATCCALAACVGGVSLWWLERDTRRTLALYAMVRAMQALYNVSKHRGMVWHWTSLLSPSSSTDASASSSCHTAPRDTSPISPHNTSMIPTNPSPETAGYRTMANTNKNRLQEMEGKTEHITFKKNTHGLLGSEQSFLGESQSTFGHVENQCSRSFVNSSSIEQQIDQSSPQDQVTTLNPSATQRAGDWIGGHGDLLLFAISSAQIMYAYALHPDTLPASFYKFMIRTGPVAEEALQAVRSSVATGQVVAKSIETHVISQRKDWLAVHGIPRNTTERSNNAQTIRLYEFQRGLIKLFKAIVPRSFVQFVRLPRLKSLQQDGLNFPWRKANSDVSNTLVPLALIPSSVLHPKHSSMIFQGIQTWLDAAKRGFPLYMSIHFVTPLVLRLRHVSKHPLEWILRACRGTIKSTAFLSTFVSLYMVSIDIQRLGQTKELKMTYWISGLIASTALLLESKSRRAELALYVVPRAVDSLWQLMKRKRVTRSIPYGEIVLFSISMAALMACSECENEAVSKPVQWILRRFVPLSEETLDDMHESIC